MLAAEKCVYNLTCSRRVAVRLERIVGVHCVKSARKLVNVGLNDVAVVKGDWRVDNAQRYCFPKQPKEFAIQNETATKNVNCFSPDGPGFNS